MAIIHVDGKQLEVNGAHNLLQACLSLGLDIPYFCWHPALGSVGACRQCAVKQYNTAEDQAAGRGRLVMSCMTPVADNNTFISIDDAEAKAFRATIVEYLMSNHPHDCPVCEEGGHCHLQDMTVMTGHDRRRYRFTKRTHHNQDLGNFIAHEMNRCIACYRCVRYYSEYAGGTDLGVYSSSNNVYFGREQDGTLESEFAGNLTEVCPTGVFTDKTHSARYNRKWDMQYAPSICQQCSVGCNTSPGERYGELRRVENRFNGAVNHYFLCDRGRFGTGYVNAEDRPKHALQKQAGQLTAIATDTALDAVVTQLKGKKILGVGSPRASVETNYALKQLVGANNYSTGMVKREQQTVEAAIRLMQSEGVYVPSLREIEDYDAVLILGEDVTQTAPRIALAVRQAAKTAAEKMAAQRKTQDWLAEPVSRIGQRVKSPVYLISPSETRLADVAVNEVVASPNDIARLGFAIAASVAGESMVGFDADMVAYANEVADVLKQAQKPLVITGCSLQQTALIDAATALVRALPNVGVSVVTPEVNSVGVALLGGLALEDAIVSDYDALVVVENDLYYRLPKALARQVMSKANYTLVVDHQLTPTAQSAMMVLPAASFAEGDGTVVSQEGRAQRYFQVYNPQYYAPDNQVKEAWRWLHVLKQELSSLPIAWQTLDDVVQAIATSESRLAAITDVAPNADYRVGGLKIAREPRRYSGRTAMRAPLSVHEPRQPQDQDSALTFSMEGYVGAQTDSSLIPFAWAPGWNSPSSWNKFQDEVGGHLKSGDAGVRLFDRLPKQPLLTPLPPTVQQYAQGQFVISPLHAIFASDETSARSPVMQARKPEATLKLNDADAKRLMLKQGDPIQINVGHEQVVLVADVLENFPEGVVGYPVGVAPAIDLGVFATLTVSQAAHVKTTAGV